MANELEEKPIVEDTDPAKPESVDEQVEKRMQRLNLYFEKENVSAISNSLRLSDKSCRK